MKLCTIFADHLFSVKYDGSEKAVIHELFDKWEDTEYLYDYFEQHRDLVEKGPWKDYTSEKLALMAVEEGLEFFDRLCDIVSDPTKSFDDEFVFLNKESVEWQLVKYKSYGFPHNWSVKLKRNALLRLYAIKIDTNQYVITGGGIKLVQEMHEMPELEVELNRLKRVRDWLLENKVHISKEVDPLLEVD